MAYDHRQDLIRQLEEARDSRVIAYFLADRNGKPQNVPGLSTKLSNEVQPRVIQLLREIGEEERLDLFLYTRGGSTDSVWPLVKLLRSYCDHLSVIVPFRAHSGGTLICLGADEIVMSKHAELSPIDPTTGNQFNPRHPENPNQQFGISVEDVAAFFKLAEERGEIEQEPHVLEVFKELTQEVHPLALGNVQRVHMQIRLLAAKLLALHLDEETHARDFERIIERLTEKFYSHVHAISRDEAREVLGDWVNEPNGEVAGGIWDLYRAYAEDLDLDTPFSLREFMGDDQTRELTVTGAFLETTETSHLYQTEMRAIQRPNLPEGMQVQVQPGQPIPLVDWATRSFDLDVKRSGWEENDEGV